MKFFFKSSQPNIEVILWNFVFVFWLLFFLLPPVPALAQEPFQEQDQEQGPEKIQERNQSSAPITDMNFVERCKQNWEREVLQATLSDWMDHPESLTVEKFAIAFQRQNFSATELRLLDHLGPLTVIKSKAQEVKELTLARTSCELADLTVSGIPFLAKSYELMPKTLDYNLVRRRQSTDFLEANSATTNENALQKNYNTTSSFWQKPRTWGAVVASVLIYSYFQKRYQIEY